MYKMIGILVVAAVLSGCDAMMGAAPSSTSSAPGFTGYDAKINADNDPKGERHFPAHTETNGEKMFIFDPGAGAWAAYDSNGDRVKSGRGSGGKSFCPDTGEPCKTVAGTFRVHTKRGADCVSNKFPLGEGGAKMPHCMFFHKGFAVHGSAFVPDQPSSHGCVRVLPDAAEWLHNNFMDLGTKVVIEPYHGG